MCGTHSLLLVHSAFSVSRLAYAAPYFELSTTQQLKLERRHKTGMQTALCVPRQADTK